MNKRVVNGKALGLPFWKNAADVVALARAGRGIVEIATARGPMKLITNAAVVS